MKRHALFSKIPGQEGLMLFQQRFATENYILYFVFRKMKKKTEEMLSTLT